MDVICDANQQLNGSSGGVSLKDSPTIGFMYANIYEYFEGQITVLIFEDILTDEERFELQAYLSNKWGLTATVDSDNDGFTDAAEIAFGSTTTDPSSLPQFVGATAANPGSSCKMIADAAGAPLSDGVYWIQLSNGPANAFEVYCHNMTSDFPTEYLELKKSVKGWIPRGIMKD